mmetsp:Transcript_226/g.316  ORF Transcript_226/g.316 Transcript_226/m.316 type:complete len:1086 (+) Transcript_226:192-3449(+)
MDSNYDKYSRANVTRALSKNYNDGDDLGDLDSPILPARLSRLSALGSSFSTVDKEVKRLGDFLMKGSQAGFACYIVLMLLLYLVAPEDSYGTLEEPEYSATGLVFVLLFVTNGSRLIPLFFRESSKFLKTGAMIGSLTVQGIALSGSAIMLLLPTPIMMDNVTGRKVYMFRWVEWVPLSFLMTFLTEAIDMPNNPAAVELAWGHGVCIAVSTFAGFLFPFCHDVYTWMINFVVSCVLFSSLYIRLYQRTIRFRNTPKGNSVDEKEHFDRVRLSLRLLQVCSIWWSGLVLAFVLCCFADRYAPPDSFFASEALPCLVECCFEVGSKVWYLSFILDVHELVFDEGSRAVRRLEEMRDMMSVVWESSSDVIALCVKGHSSINAVLSPTFLGLQKKDGMDHNIALVLEITPQGEGMEPLHSVFAMNMVAPMSKEDIKNSAELLKNVVNNDKNSTDQRNLSAMAKLVIKAFEKNPDEATLMHDLYGVAADGSELNRQCEAKVTKLASDALVVVLRDISERFQRFEAEKQLIQEVTERKKDAQANRFPRHEVKNGLLAAIGLLDSMKESAIDPVEFDKALRLHRAALSDNTSLNTENQSIQSGVNVSDLATHMIDLDQTLHEILDTIMAEAMARDVIHGVYHPRHERIEVHQVLHSMSKGSRSAALRFPIMSSPAPFPELMLDPQLLRHIHRNAVSNAVKYGKDNGIVTTELYYDYINKLFLMNVINLPGDKHDKLLRMGDDEAKKVFNANTRLHENVEVAQQAAGNLVSTSSGDGAWIMQKCAAILGGECMIRFEPLRTIFSLRVPAEAYQAKLVPTTITEVKRFRLPENTWGVAIDDSGIQRKLLSRFLSLAGIRKSKRKVWGSTPAEIFHFGELLGKLMRSNPDDRFLVIVDENLEILDGGAHKQTISGSMAVQNLRDSLSEYEESRLLTLIRSANDSAEDIAVYQERAHGFLAKAPIQKDKVLELLEPWWNDRFPEDTLDRLLETAEEEFLDDHLSILNEELLGALDVLDNLLKLNDGETMQQKWPSVRDRLHALRGDLKTMKTGKQANLVLEAMEKLRGEKVPDDLEANWKRIREMLVPLFSGGMT